jgi:GT2 family glycosyltransferase
MNVLTLVHGRRAHLDNLIRGLEQSTMPLEALVIVQMNEAPGQWESNRFPIVHHALQSRGSELPLAAARNAAVIHAPGNDLVFLDVDCIPAPDLLARYRAALADHAAELHQGEVLYLPEGAAHRDASFVQLTHSGTPHPLHVGRQAGELVPHALFWSLNFACRRETFERIGRFDAGYLGYGGEDTDFAFRASAAGVPVRFVEATALHQYHPSFDPPLNHLASIVENARRFRERWGVWPMGGWLAQFRDLGFIEFTDSEIVLRRMPTQAELETALQ